MTVLKYIGIALGGLLLIALIALAVLLYFMNSASKAGSAKISTLEQEFPVGQSIDNLIARAEQLQINNIWWEADGSKEKFDDHAEIPNGAKINGATKGPIDFKLVQEKFKNLRSGNICLLAYGSWVLERYIISINFAERKVTKVELRTID